MKVLDPDPEKGIIPFEAWPHLKELYNLSRLHNQLIILKARQIGVSWLWAAIGLWEVLFFTGRNVAIFSKKGVDSTEMMKGRIRNVIYDELPRWMQAPLGKDNDEILEFVATKSKVQAFPATEDAGRSGSATLVILDEWAFHEHADVNWSAISPTAERGRIIGISTANGKANKFYELWSAAKAGENDLFPVFINWTARPGRTTEWWERQKKNLGTKMALQEYPLYENDAFLVSGDCFFEIDDLHDMDTYNAVRRLGPSLVFTEYDPDRQYVAAIDTALGKSDNRRDVSVLQILDRETGEQVAILRARIPLEEWSIAALRLLEDYGSPTVIIESQPQGELVALIFLANSYPRVWQRDKDTHTIHSTPGLRQTIINDLAMSIRTEDMEIHDEYTINECLGFTWNEKKNKFMASGSGHDDTVMALAWANYLRSAKAFAPKKKEHRYATFRRKKGRQLTDVDWSVR